MMLIGNCTKCGTEIHLDIGSLSRLEAIEKFKQDGRLGFHCPGHHVEISSPYPTY